MSGIVLGQTVVVQNRAGGGGNIGMSSVINSSPSAGLVADAPEFLVVSTALGVDDLKAFIALAKQKEFNFGSPGLGKYTLFCLHPFRSAHWGEDGRGAVPSCGPGDGGARRRRNSIRDFD